MNKTIADVFAHVDLDKSVLIGYYGGGNFGDELLLEVLMNLFSSNQVKDLTVTYQHPKRYDTYHHDFGYTKIDMADKKSVFKSILKNKNVVIGGGGLWGLDVNPNIFILSSLLFFSRFILRKRVFLLGVGYYGSTSRLGHISAWLAGKAANEIVTRDPESLANFKKISKHVSIDNDIAFQIPSLKLGTYTRDLEMLASTLKISKKTLFITLRRFKPSQNNDFANTIEMCLLNNQDMNCIVALLEPQDVDPEGFALLEKWQQQYPNIQVIDFSYNPFALVLLFETYKQNIALIAPQFHAIIGALLTDVPFLPIVYDNKVMELLKKTTTQTPIPIKNLTDQQVQQFIDNFKQATL